MAKMIAERRDVVPVLAEVFRAYGFEGASLARITEGTRLGKGSLYHFFPGGKEEMAAAVLSDIGGWFRTHVFDPLRSSDDGVESVAAMFREVRRYFLSGRRVCLVGMFALGNERDRFTAQVGDYFSMWADSLREALMRAGRDEPAARELAEDIIVAIQGGLVLARARNEPETFIRTLDRMEKRLAL